jgi:uncharacterized protein (DUF2141 family)
MKKLVMFIAFLFISSFAYSQEKYKVTVKVQGIGENFVAYLIDGDQNFPGPTPTSKMLTLKSEGSMATFEFDQVPMGTYAVFVFHDKNGNGTLDMNGSMPAEAFGYSNYVVMGPPVWEACSFSVEEDMEVEVNLVSL